MGKSNKTKRPVNEAVKFLKTVKKILQSTPEERVRLKKKFDKFKAEAEKKKK